ncbi:DUF4212 domain-containing protein [Bacillus fonticola]|uniref:DUF4212 domain-containing protein n=1 Tax=Bacillus fonticola TaxID=2728853 RepID=UPI0014759FDE|nr:DUF4212 domain-containing protein [Bacillus fonticola]
MKKIDKTVADAYFREKNRYLVLYFVVWFVVSYGVVFFAEPLSSIQIFGGFPLHYYMGAQGAVLTFIGLLFVNAVVADKIDKKYGINEAKNQQISSGRAVDH